MSRPAITTTDGRQMTHTPDKEPVSRRSVLRKGAVASVATVVGGTALAGTSAASSTTNFAYVDDGVGNESGPYTLETRLGRSQPGCGVQRPRCEQFRADDGTVINIIATSFEVGDTITFTGKIADCPGPNKEVSIDLVSD